MRTGVMAAGVAAGVRDATVLHAELLHHRRDSGILFQLPHRLLIDAGKAILVFRMVDGIHSDR